MNALVPLGITADTLVPMLKKSVGIMRAFAIVVHTVNSNVLWISRRRKVVNAEYLYHYLRPAFAHGSKEEVIKRIEAILPHVEKKDG